MWACLARRSTRRVASNRMASTSTTTLSPTSIMPAVKRRAASPPIDPQHSPSSPKRARTEDDEPEQVQQGTRSKGKARQEDGEIDIQQGLEEETPEQEAPDEDEERKFEEENEEIIRETIMNKGRTQGVSGIYTTCMRMKLSLVRRVWPRWVSSSHLRCTISCVTNT